MTIVVAMLVASIGIELAHRTVYGRIIPSKQLDAFMDKHLDSYELNEYSESKLLHSMTLPYIAGSWSPLSRWVLEDIGTIPFWSPWNRIISERYKVLNRTRPVKTGIEKYL